MSDRHGQNSEEEPPYKITPMVNPDGEEIGAILTDGFRGVLCQTEESCIFCSKIGGRAENSLLCNECQTKLNERLQWDKCEHPASYSLKYVFEKHGVLPANTPIWDGGNNRCGFIHSLNMEPPFNSEENGGGCYEISRDPVEKTEGNLYAVALFNSIWLKKTHRT